MARKKQMYNEGDETEEILLDLFTNPNTTYDREELLHSSRWEFVYHLSKRRQNIINWYPFKKESKLLEIGAGTGIISECLATKVNNLKAIELSPRRADIARGRMKDSKHVEIITKNLEDYTETGFDYVVIVGVLEYAGKFIASESPFTEFLKLCFSKLKEGGKLFVAIENRLGLKYWTGYPEDHVNKLFEGIEGYPDFLDDEKGGIKTFSEPELKELLEESGFKNHEVYYPTPNYKLPIELFSKEYQPSENHPVNPYAARDPYQNKPYELITDERALRSIVNGKAYGNFANSLLTISEK